MTKPDFVRKSYGISHTPAQKLSFLPQRGRIIQPSHHLEVRRIGMGIPPDPHPQLPHHPLRRKIVISGGGDDAPQAQMPERLVDQGSRRFRRVPPPLMGGGDGPIQAEFRGVARR